MNDKASASAHLASLIDKSTGEVHDTKSIQEWGDLCGIEQSVIDQLNTQADDVKAKLEDLVRRAVAAADRALALEDALGLVDDRRRLQARTEFVNRALAPTGFILRDGVVVKKSP